MIKDIVLGQFDRCYDVDGWFVAVRNAIDGLTVERSIWKPVDSINCIWEMLSHLTYYNSAYLQRFKGIDFEYDISSNDETFNVGEFDESHWQADVTSFNAVMTEWRRLLHAADESKFAEFVPNKVEVTWAEVVADINAHNAYHGGQMLLLRKLQGSWDPDKGVS